MSARSTSDATEEAARLLQWMLASGPVPCQVVGARASGLRIPLSAQVQARRLLGVETVRDEAGEPHYKLPG